MNAGFRFLIGLLIVAMIAMVGVYTYDLGVAHGIAQSGAIAAAPAPGAAAPGAVAPAYYYYYPRHWGWGYGFFPFAPLFFLFFFFVVLRGLFWGRRWRRGYYGYYGCGPHGYYDRVPPEFEEWHRRAHDPNAPKTTNL